MGKLIESSYFKRALEEIFEIVQFANKYFATQKPWLQIDKAPIGCKETMSNCTIIIANLAQLLAPFLPFSSNELKKTLQLKDFSWEFNGEVSHEIKEVEPLFARIDLSIIKEEVDKLQNQAKDCN